MSCLKKDIAEALEEFAWEQKEQQFSAVYCFPPEASFFAGHFPEMPLVPGVLQVEMVRHCAERVEGEDLALSCIQQSKFRRQIEPGQLAEVKGSLVDKNGVRHVQAKITIGDGTAAEMHLLLRRSDDE